jgi:predicted CoA-binding protein
MMEAASQFLASKQIAVTCVSRKPKEHGSNTVYKRLRDRGYEVFAVIPNADEVEGARSYHDLKSIPGGVDAVVIATAPDKADGTMRECAELGIKQVWMHRSYGQGSVSGRGLWVRARHHRHRRRMPADVRADRRLRPQGHAGELPPSRTEDRLTVEGARRDST